jgi:hypothetical protein
MQWDKLKQNIGYRVRLVPAACRLDEFGIALPERDEEWIIGQGQDETITISMVGYTGHSFPLGKDQIHHFTSDPQRSLGDTKHGFLTLLVQVFIQGARAWVKPALRPGEAVAPPPVKIEDRVVDFNYPADSGLQRRLEAQGYKLSWCLESRLSRATELNGWEVVVDRTRDGSLTRFRLKDPRDDQVLVKKLAG